MKKIFWFLSIAALTLSIAACEEKEKPNIEDLTEDGFYVALDPTGKTAVTAKEMMANGINEADSQSPREGMYEKYIVLEANKEFSLAYITGGKMELYGANLSEFKADLTDPVYDSNPADAVFKGALVIGSDAPRMKVSTTGLYHIVLDLNKKGDLANEQIVLCPVTMGVRGGMNSWGFTAFDATAPSNDGITFTLSGQKLADGGEFKFAYNNAWKITLDAAGAVKANTNLGEGCKPGGDNIKVTEGAGAYKITLNYKLAAGDISKSFSYSIEQESKSETPTTMYMIGQDFGNWDWNSAGVAELVPVWGKEGAFWCTRYFTTNGFKFCALREWNGDFTNLGSDEGYTVDGGNCFVPAEGMYTVYINLLDKVLEIKPAEVYGLGDAVFKGGWDFDTAEKFSIENGKAVLTTSGAGELRLASKVLPTTKVEGCGDHGWFDWWKTEFIFFSDNKIAYRGGGNDQDRVQIEAGKKIIIDFNAGTVAVEDDNFTPAINIDGNFDDWANIPTAEPAAAFKAFKVTNDAKNFYFYVESDPGSRLWSGGAYLYLYFNFKNDLSQGAYSGKTGMGDNKYDAYIFMYLFGGSADSPKIEDNPNGGSAEGMSMDNIVIAGNKPASSSDIVKMEIVVPRANFATQVNAGDAITVDCYRSKDGGNIYFPGYVVK